jgi:hypothetical protein
MGDHPGRPAESASRERSIGLIAGPKVEHERIALAVDKAIFLPQLKNARAVRPGAEEGPRGRNRFLFSRSLKFGSPYDLAVPVEQVTTIFEGL